MELDHQHIHSAAFQREATDRYELSILTGMDSFTYTIRDRERNRLLAYSTRQLSPFEQGDPGGMVVRLLAEDAYLSAPNYGSVVLGWETEKITLVPRKLYRGEVRREYLAQLTTVAPDDHVEEVWYNELDAHLLYLAGGRALADLRERLHVDRIHHPSGGLLVAWAARSRRLLEPSVSIALRGSRLLVAVHRSGALQLVNTFRFRTREDVLYYTLLAYEHCGLLPTEVPLYACGELLSDTELYRCLYGYIQEIHFCRYGAPPALPPELEGLPPHLYFDLLCLA